MKGSSDGHQFDLRLRPEAGSLVVESANRSGRNLFSEDNQSDQLIMAVMRETFPVTGATVPELVEMTKLSRASVFRSRARLLDTSQLWVDKSRRLFLRTIDEDESARGVRLPRSAP
jgi:hypothetical protein